MANFSSKQLYMMNAGNKLYIHKDGFGDVYKATVAEEALWAKEVVANALDRIESESNSTNLQFAIDSLLFHQYDSLETLLAMKSVTATPARSVVFATALWKIYKHTSSFEIIRENLVKYRSECLNIVFLSLGDFKDNANAKSFIVSCLQGDDYVLIEKASITIGIWAYSGIASLRKNDLLDLLKPANKNSASFKKALEQLKEILTASFNY